MVEEASKPGAYAVVILEEEENDHEEGNDDEFDEDGTVNVSSSRRSSMVGQLRERRKEESEYRSGNLTSSCRGSDISMNSSRRSSDVRSSRSEDISDNFEEEEDEEIDGASSCHRSGTSMVETLRRSRVEALKRNSHPSVTTIDKDTQLEVDTRGRIDIPDNLRHQRELMKIRMSTRIINGSSNTGNVLPIAMVDLDGSGDDEEGGGRRTNAGVDLEELNIANRTRGISLMDSNDGHPPQRRQVIVIQTANVERFRVNNRDINSAKSQTLNRRKKVGITFCFVVLLLLIIISGIVFGIMNRNKNETDNDSGWSGYDMTMDDDRKFEDVLPSYTKVYIDQLTKNHSSGNNPQSLAYNWLLQDPSYNSYTIDQKLQRYALATIFYAMTMTTPSTSNIASTYQSSWDTNKNWLQYDNGTECQTWFTTHGFSVCEYLELEDNNLMGTIPLEIGLLTSLRTINLKTNILLGGTLPTTIGLLTNLQNLIITNTSLVGTLPTEIGNLYATTSRIKHIALDNNNLTGTVPTEIGRLLYTTLHELYLHNNFFTGTLPNELFFISEIGNNNDSNNKQSNQLTSFDVSFNKFNGTIPTLIGLLTNIENLYLHGNSFTGTIPTEIGLMKYATDNDDNKYVILQFQNNSLEGTIPTEMGLLTRVSELYLNDNNFIGTLPTEIGLLTLLRWLDISSNTYMTGSIPSEFGLLNNLEYLLLGNNSFNNTIPIEFGNMTLIKEIDISHNKIQGAIPTEIGILRFIYNLYINDNLLSGTLCTELGALSNGATAHTLHKLHMQNNKLEGTIPIEIYDNLYALTELDISNNQLNGTISTYIGFLDKLEYLHMQNNLFTGILPLKDFKYLSNIKSIQVQGNDELTILENSIPVELCSLINIGQLTEFITTPTCSISGNNGNHFTVGCDCGCIC